MKKKLAKRSRSAGPKLLGFRSAAGLTMRDVEAESAKLARKLRNPAYKLSIARLCAYEAKGLIPNIFAMYTLSTIYRRPIMKLLRIYALPV
jgi:hypothetical protein